MGIDAVSNRFFQAAKEVLDRTDNKMRVCIATAEIFITIAVLFNPWTLGFIVPLSAHVITISAAVNAFAAIGLISTLFFYTEYSLTRKDIESEVSIKRAEILKANPLFSTKDRPVGLINQSQNCWGNALFQLIMNSQRYEESLRKCPVKFNGVSLETLMNQYREDQNYFLDVSSVQSQNLREIIHLISKSFSSNPGEQVDSTEAFNILSDWLPKAPIRYISYYDSKGLPPPDKAKYRPEEKPSANNCYSMEISDNRFSTAHNENINKLELEITSGFLTLSFRTVKLEALIDHHFEKEHFKNEKSSFLNDSSQAISYPLISRELKLVEAHEDLCIALKRFIVNEKPDSADHGKKVYEITKKTKDVKVPLKLALEKKHGLKEKSEYQLDSFIVHIGSIDGGHYKAYVQKRGHWFECNDSLVSSISEEDAVAAAKQAYMVHYSKLSSSG